MTQSYVSVVFDRKKKANTNKSGKGKIELYGKFDIFGPREVVPG